MRPIAPSVRGSTPRGERASTAGVCGEGVGVSRRSLARRSLLSLRLQRPRARQTGHSGAALLKSGVQMGHQERVLNPERLVGTGGECRERGRGRCIAGAVLYVCCGFDMLDQFGVRGGIQGGVEGPTLGLAMTLKLLCQESHVRVLLLYRTNKIDSACKCLSSIFFFVDTERLVVPPPPPRLSARRAVT
ncbi:hypothetical protein F2P81_015580 [Scophthalmus maximus]|uniref:Uncharacterized protein n=1 Tax=Scophthalmus maximus TaxID=52904 RepID=A0A6A4SMW6_SCOMX|nr:hypothetical protein F2P81_015580 [Scophthalmus maximus]